jgi:sugar fermentation stimulation protein A
MDVERFAPAWSVDPEYARTLRDASQKGVEVIPLQARVSTEKIEIAGEMPFSIQPSPRS